MHPLVAILLPPLVAVAAGLAARRLPPDRILVLGGILAVLPFLICLLWAFPTLDDWSYGAAGRGDWWQAQVGTYQTWSGRVVATAILTSWGLLGTGSWVVAISYHLILFTVVGGLAWSLWRVAGQVVPHVLRLPAVVVVASAWVMGMPTQVEGLYWLAGTATYQGGTALALAMVALMAGASTPWSWCLAAFLGV